MFDRIRRLFAATGEGLTPSLFSFNSPGGRVAAGTGPTAPYLRALVG